MLIHSCSMVSFFGGLPSLCCKVCSLRKNDWFVRWRGSGTGQRMSHCAQRGLFLSAWRCFLFFPFICSRLVSLYGSTVNISGLRLLCTVTTLGAAIMFMLTPTPSTVPTHAWCACIMRFQIMWRRKKVIWSMLSFCGNLFMQRDSTRLMNTEIVLNL